MFPESLIELTRFNEDTYAFRSGGYISVFITTDQGVIVVDAIGGGNRRRTPDALKAAIAMVTDQPVRYLVYSRSAEDHGSGGIVFADTAEFVGHRNTASELVARPDPRAPVPTITFDDALDLELGGKTVQLRWNALQPSDTCISVRYRNVLNAVDLLRPRSLPYADIPTGPPQGIVDCIARLEADSDWDTVLFGHAIEGRIAGTREDAREYREYLQDLMAGVRAARAAGLADNSEEMVEAIRRELAPRYGTWASFSTWLPSNIQGVIRWWSQEA
ncbi:MAG TPA: hypothetical protein VGK54_01835 [Chloroflexota bacterium]